MDSKRLIVSNKIPLGLDLSQVAEQRDALAAARIQQRIAELRALPSNLPAEQKTKALIELKALKLVELQRKVREDIVNSLQQNTSLEVNLNRNIYKRARKTAVKEARMTERLERQQQVRFSPLIDQRMEAKVQPDGPGGARAAAQQEAARPS